MTKWQAHVAHITKHMNMVGGPLWWGSLGPAPLSPPKSGVVLKDGMGVSVPKISDILCVENKHKSLSE